MTYRTALLLIALAFTSSIAFAQEGKSEIDILNAKLNGTNLFALSPDAVTDLLGRPTFVQPVKSSPEAGKEGVQLWYQNKGLAFVFAHPDESTNQTCTGVEIYLSKRGEWQPCTATLTKKLDGNWKVKRVLEEFSEYKPIDAAESPQLKDELAQSLRDLERLQESFDAFQKASLTGANAREMEDILQKAKQATHNGKITLPIAQLRYKVVLAGMYVVSFVTATDGVIMHYEPTTKFIEFVRLVDSHKRGNMPESGK